jgi:DNA-binding PadR family transcriptional regulator
VWIEILLLANLVTEPSHGYELRKRVEEGTGFALSNNSLYPTLRRFTEAGAVTRVSEPQEGRPPRHVYTITDVGRELLHDMLADLSEDLAGDSSEFLARLAHFDWLTTEEQLRVLDARHQALDHRRKRIGAIGERAGSSGWRGLVLDEVARRIDDEVDWLTGLRGRAAVPTKEKLT